MAMGSSRIIEAESDGRCARGDEHWDRPDTFGFYIGEPIAWSFVGNGWAHAACVRDEEEPEEFNATPRWKSAAS